MHPKTLTDTGGTRVAGRGTARWRRRVAALGTGLGVLAVLGTTAVAKAPPSTIVLSEGIQAQPNYFLPMLPARYCTGENGGYSGEVYRPLLWVTRNATIDYDLSIASGITVSDHYTTFTLHINHRYRWSNGKPVTAQDVLFSYDLVREMSQPKSPWVYCNTGQGGLPALWGKATAPNPSTVVIHTARPVDPDWFELNGIGQLYPLPAAVWDLYPTNWAKEINWLIQTGANPSAKQLKVVDGAYQYGPFVTNQSATLLANPAYTGPQPATIHTVTMLYDTSVQAEYLQLLNGTLSTAAIPTTYYGSIRQLEQRGYKITPYPYIWAYQYLVLNMWPQSPVASLFDQRYIRQALQMGIDQQGMVKLADGLAYTERGPVPTVPSNPYADPHLPPLKFDPTAGRALLEAHGWKMERGVMTKGKQTLSFQLEFPPGSPWLENSMQLLQRDWAEEGVKVTLSQGQDAITLLTTPSDRAKWEIIPFNWGYQPDFFPDGGGLFDPGGTVNFGGYDNPSITNLINAVYRPGTQAQVIQALFNYQKAINQQLPVLFLPENTSYEATKAWLVGPQNLNGVQGLPYYNQWRILKH
jgi:peptide/nickel transport system substrate-binding protein